MITRYGMSEKLGPITFGDDNDEVFLGMQYSHVRNYSEEIAAEIDKEVNRIITEQYARTEQILTEHMDSLHLVANALLEKEKLEGDEFKVLLETGSLPGEADEAAEKTETQASESVEAAQPARAETAQTEQPSAPEMQQEDSDKSEQ